jgi:hypothetical protein
MTVEFFFKHVWPWWHVVLMIFNPAMVIWAYISLDSSDWTLPQRNKEVDAAAGRVFTSFLISLICFPATLAAQNNVNMTSEWWYLINIFPVVMTFVALKYWYMKFGDKHIYRIVGIIGRAF